MTPEYAEQAAAVASKVTYGGAAGTAFFGLTLNEWGVLIGILIGVLGYLTNLYYKHKSFLLREQEHHARMSSRNRRSTDPKYFKPDDDDE